MRALAVDWDVADLVDDQPLGLGQRFQPLLEAVFIQRVRSVVISAVAGDGTGPFGVRRGS